MTTIEHLAVVNLRLARKCAHWRKVASCTMIALEAAANDKYKATDAKREAEAKLADAERRLAERGLYDGIAADFEKCRHQRDAEKARADAAEASAKVGWHQAEYSAKNAKEARAEVERLTKERNAWSGRAGNFAGGEELAKREVERLQVAIGKERTDNERLRGIIGRALASCGCSSTRAILREVDVPTVPSGFPGNLLREADAPPVETPAPGGE